MAYSSAYWTSADGGYTLADAQRDKLELICRKLALTPADMHMRPVGETIALIENAGLEVLGTEAMREHYVRTIHAWQDNFRSHEEEISALLTGEQIRVWRLYLAGGALAFAHGRMGVDQILAVRR